MISHLTRLFSTDIGIDLGTANCLVYIRDLDKLVLNEPSVVVRQVNTHEVRAVGIHAKEMLGKTPVNYEAIRPIKDGVVADIDVTDALLREFIKKALQQIPWYRRLLPPRVAIAVPSCITSVEKGAVKESCKKAGAGIVKLVEEPMAAAFGAGLPVNDACGSMIVDIGGGTTEVAIISLSGCVCCDSIRVGGDELDEAIMQYMRKAYNLIIGELTAERIKINIGSAYPVRDELRMEISGVEMNGGMLRTVTITGREIRKALEEQVCCIAEKVRSVFEHCKPELAADLVNNGIMLAGGGAMLAGLDRLLSEETGLPVFVAEDPLNAVAKGTGLLLNEEELWTYYEN